MAQLTPGDARRTREDNHETLQLRFCLIHPVSRKLPHPSGAACSRDMFPANYITQNNPGKKK